MKADQFASGLKAFALLHNAELAGAVNALAEVLEAQGGASIATLSKKAKKLPKNLDGGPTITTVKQVKQVLTQLANLFRQFEIKSVSDDVTRIVDCLSDHDQEPFSDYIDRVSKSLSEKDTTAPTNVDQQSRDVVGYYLGQLEKWNYDPIKFADVISKLSADKRVRVRAELTEIANKFYDVDFKYATKQKALDIIQRRHAQDNRVRNEDRSFRGQRK